MRTIKNYLSLILLPAMMLSLVFAIPVSADELALSPDRYDAVFLSDLHNGVGSYTGLKQMMDELKDEGQNPRVLSLGGDYVEDGMGGQVDWQTQVYDVISSTERDAFPDAMQVYTMGNHDWENGTFGGRTDKEAAFQEIFGFPRCGLAYADDEMEIYTIGAQGVTGAGGGGEAFIQADIDAFDQYLSTKAGSGKAIFLQTHWPAHSSYNFKQRVVTNADKLIDVMNKYSDDLDLVWIWGHNHYEDEMRYVILQPGDQIMYAADTSKSSWGKPYKPKYKTIQFTYANAGCMNDMWYLHDGHNDTNASGNYRGPSACLSVAVEKNTITFTYNRITQDENGEWVFSHDANLQIYNHNVLKEHPANVTVDRFRIALNSIGEIKYGSSYDIAGQVRSPSDLISVTGEILKIIPAQDQADHTEFSYESIQTHTEHPAGKILELADSEISHQLDFSTLDPGNYTLMIAAENLDGAVTSSFSFTVAPPPKPKMTLSKFAKNTIPYGSDPNITGTVTSTDAQLTRVKGEILSGTTVIQTYTENPDGKTLNLAASEINDNLDFSMLDPGTYTLMIAAENIGGEATSSFNFTVAPPSKPSISLKTFDKIKIPYGSDPDVTGTVTSAVAKLTWVKGEILSGTTVIQTDTEDPDGKTLNLAASEISDNLDFSLLMPGSYKLKIAATNIGGTTAKTVSFTIKKPPLPTIELDSIGAIPYGSDHMITGTVASTDADLTSVTAQILSGTTKKQTCTSTPNDRTLDLESSVINDKLDFSILGPGAYKLKITATNLGGTTTKTISFTIKKPPLPTIELAEIGTIPYESDYIIKGTISSPEATLTSVKAQILSGTTKKQDCPSTPNVRTLDLESSEINDKLDFSILGPGTYKLKITATNIGGTTTKTISFSISQPPKATIELVEIGTIPYESDCIIKGTIRSPEATLTSVTAQILSGTTKKQGCTLTPNVRTLDLESSEINDKLDFSKLMPGNYKLKISAKNVAGTTTKTISFTISQPPKPSIELAEIGKAPYGSDYIIKGTINSPEATLSSVKAQILSGTTVKQTCTSTPNDRTLDLESSVINDKLDFSKLKVGSYKLKITAKNVTGTTTATIPFSIAAP